MFGKCVIVSAALLAASAAWAEPAPPLVDAAWVKANSCADGVTVLDIRNRLGGGSKADYLQAHIPCAVYSDYLKDGWRKEVDGVVGQLPPPQELEKLIGSLGIDNDAHVVIAPGGVSALDMGSATRVFWTFKVLGHDRVSILDGGMSAYLADKTNPTESGENPPQATSFNAELRRDILADKDEVKSAVDSGAASLVDNRPSDMFLGVNRHGKAKRSGTLPGAVSLPERWLTRNGGGSFRDKAVLSKLYQSASVPTEGEQINFCNTGHWASLGWFVSHELLGNREAKLYDGSMVEWSADESLPIKAVIQAE